MRRIFGLGVLILAGCSTAPVAGLMDCVFPSQVEGSAGLPRGRDEMRDGPDWDRIPPPGLGLNGAVDPLPAPAGLNKPIPAESVPTSRREAN